MSDNSDDFYGDSTITFNPIQEPNTFTVTMKAPDVYVTIKPDGTIEYGPGYTPTEAAKAFWDAVGLERITRVVS